MKIKKLNLSQLSKIVITTLGLSLLNISYAQVNTPANIMPSNNSQIVNKESSNSKEYQGRTFDKIKNSGKIVIGVRSSSIPLSYTTNFKENGKPIGYAIDICNAIIDRYKLKYMLQEIQTQYVFVTEKNHISLVKDGTLDMECSSSTNNENNRKDVAFSIPYYISSAKIIALNKRTDIEDLHSLKGKSIAFIKGSTIDRTINEFNTNRNLKINKIEAVNPEDAMIKLTEGKVDAFAYDDLILYSLRNNSNNETDYKILPEVLSIDPQSIMLRKNDKEFSNFIDEELKNLIKTGQVQSLYSKWFLSPIAPKNKTIGIQQSKLLKDIFRFPTATVGN